MLSTEETTTFCVCLNEKMNVRLDSVFVHLRTKKNPVWWEGERDFVRS